MAHRLQVVSGHLKTGAVSINSKARKFLCTLKFFSSDLQVESSSGSMSRPPITTHVLDTALGRPASGVPIRLCQVGEDKTTWQVIGSG